MSKKIKGCFCGRSKAKLNLPPLGSVSSIKPGEPQLIFVVRGSSKGAVSGLTGERNKPSLNAMKAVQYRAGGDHGSGNWIEYCDQINLDIGETVRSFAGDVSRLEQGFWLPYVEKAVAGTYAQLPICINYPGLTRVGGLALKGSISGRCLMLTIYGSPDLDRIPWGAGGCQPIFTLAISPGGTEGADIWKSLSADSSGMYASELANPETPWCAVRVFPDGLKLFQEARAVLAKLRNCLPWVWFDIMMPAIPAPNPRALTHSAQQRQAANDDPFDVGSAGE